MGILCLICACWLAALNQEGWGWFLFAAVLLGGK